MFGAVGKPKVIAELNLYISLLSVIPLVPFTINWKINGTFIAMTIPAVIVAVLTLQ